MKKPGRKRSSSNIPAHINADKLPDHVWFKTEGAGKWLLNYTDEYGRRKNRRLCGAEATLSEIWQAAEAQVVKRIETFATVSGDFQQTHTWKKLSPLTQKDYINCHQSITTRNTSTGKLGDLPLPKWTVGLIRKYRDKRATESESRANKELSYIKRVMAWAYEYEKIPLNPATGIKKLSIAPRKHYATDLDYHYLLNIARQSNYYYLYYAMELAFLCRMRQLEVLDLTDAAELDTGLLIKRRKGSKTNICEWQPRLRAVWDELKQKRNAILSERKQPQRIKAEDRFLFISERTGDKIDSSTIQTAMHRVTEMAVAQAKKDGVEFTKFTFHDLKKKGITETTGDKMTASGHRTQAMVNLYDLSIQTVKPTKN